MKIILQIGMVLGICFLVEGLEMLLPFPFPASVISMLVLFVFLCLGLVKQEHINQKSDFLLQNMAFFFIPAGVGIMSDYNALKDNILPLLAVCFLTTIVTFTVTAFTVKGVIRLQNAKRRKGEK